MRQISRYASVLLATGLQLFAPFAYAQQMAAAAPSDCASDEPDSLQISWTQPCDEGDWLLDTKSGCRMWDWHPDPKDRASWNGACSSGKKSGLGVIQWTEHGQAIDRFEGTYRNGKREGFGRYVWAPEVSFEGAYANDLPNGYGTVRVLDQSFTGDWRNGCFSQGSRVIAIGVERSSCAGLSAEVERTGPASF